MSKRYGKNNKGCWVKWGASGKQYYYKCRDNAAKRRAEAKADRQAGAAYAGGYGG